MFNKLLLFIIIPSLLFGKMYLAEAKATEQYQLHNEHTSYHSQKTGHYHHHHEHEHSTVKKHLDSHSHYHSHATSITSLSIDFTLSPIKSVINISSPKPIIPITIDTISSDYIQDVFRPPIV